MKLCSHCIKNILQSKQSWDYHAFYEDWFERQEHPPQNVVELQPERARCLFCWTLHQDIKALAPGLKHLEHAAAWPVYRWNIRSLSKIRESPETVVVTFRYVPPVNLDESSKELILKKLRQELKVDQLLEEFELDKIPKEWHLDKLLEDLVEVELPTRTFFLFPENEIELLPTINQIGATTNPTLNGGRQIRSWLENCDTTHVDCMKRRKATPKANRFVPTRLLDISGRPKEPIKIIETATTPVQGPYSSLSHCWGLLKFIQLRIDSRQKFMEEGIKWSLLPNNFQQAIEVARALDIGYIWIDSLCIIQNSDADWTAEAAKMHLVYRNSYCNIAIADSPDSSKGAFRTRDPSDLVPVMYKAEDDSPFFRKKTWAVVPENLWDKELLQSFLYARGWVFQERMLSPRILHFARNQVFWDCPSLSACETLPAGLPTPMDNAAGPDRHWRGRLQEPEDNYEPIAGANDQSMETFWKLAVQKYTSCNLTKGRDKLIAMWGIAKLVRDILGIEYGEGLWEDNLEDQLAWRVDHCSLTQRPSESSNDNLKRDIPSWSWASMDGTIVVPDRLSDQLHFKVCDHDNQPLTFDLVGVKRFVRPALPRSGGNAPGLPTRAASDSGPELLRGSQQRQVENPGRDDAKDFHRSSSPEKISKDAEPKFHTTSIRVQGHVGRGRLGRDEAKGRWVLAVDGVPDGLLEIFPDLIPSAVMLADMLPYLMVLAAKKVIKEPLFMLDAGATTSLSTITEHDENANDDFDIAGHGILMKDVGKNHFHRTGAFRFRGASVKTFIALQKTHGWDLIDRKLYTADRGRKFWLD